MKLYRENLSFFYYLIKDMGKKLAIPKAVREQVWILHMGHTYASKCPISWCRNRITVFDFHVAHDIPESKGGSQNLANLRPICSRCNLSMGKTFTIREWDNSFHRNVHRHWFKRLLLSCCGGSATNEVDFTFYQQSPRQAA